jgi:uncharacterized protein YjbI with pentapeptide repeats
MIKLLPKCTSNGNYTLIFGFIISLYEILKGKSDEIKRLEEEIDDYIEWREPEAVYRNLGAIKRLLNLQMDRSKIILRGCYLDGANLRGLDLHDIDLAGAILTNANMQRVNFQGAFLCGADLKSAFLNGANLQGADLQNADLSGVRLSQDIKIKIIPNSTDEKPWTSDFKKTILSGAFLEGAKVNSSDWINSLREWDVIGYEEIADRYLIDENLELQLKSKKQPSNF